MWFPCKNLKMGGKGHAAFDKASTSWEHGRHSGQHRILAHAISDILSHYKSLLFSASPFFRLAQQTESEQAFQKAMDLTKAISRHRSFGLSAILAKAELSQAGNASKRAPRALNSALR